ncbi:methyl-accepting chemotaxis protein PctA [bacterium BMS3Bbin06]|nr:methyl-accepting chemotaxis protein PctA [bacterium BMS3Abin08]GBE33935.1 methyl-accepting chemotaxis protein PctA [bacterium BMS3Bbin06]HDO36563.1 methyl-accepting chemotaxis protein [Nitrospirota bacterium]HDY72009.1 methyl-accepting chemotaxis protein [Nitrospirota bacterium]
MPTDIKGMGIKAKLTITTLLSITIIVSAIVGYYAYSMGKRLTVLQNQRNRFYTVSVASKALDAMLTDDIKILNTITREVKASSKDIKYSFFRFEDGKIIADTFSGKIPSQLKGVGMKLKEITRDVKFPGKVVRNFSYPVATYGTINIGFKKLNLFDAIREDIWKILVIYLLAISFGLLLSLFMSNRIVRPLSALMKGIRAISEGNVNLSVDVKSTDEIGQIATVLNETLARLRGYIQTDEERKKTQENVIQFLDVVSTASEGDFTRRAPVTADVFGSIADAFNLMMDELSSLINEVRNTARGVGEDSFNLLDMLKKMSEGAEDQMVQLKDATGTIDETAGATLEISEKTDDATRISALATEAASKGGKLVNQSIEGVQLIRLTVQTINKKMKMLSERIMDIGTISGLIAEISSRTNLLAMNASIEAARAGDTGRGFVVIAEEIRGLADRSAEATKEITHIIRAIQTEAGEITASLEEETQIVERQTALASETGTSFSEIERAIDKTKGIVSEIYNLSQSQKGTTDRVVLSMESVNRISLELLNLVQDSESISERLSVSSKELLSSVEKFLLQGRDEDLIGQA